MLAGGLAGTAYLAEMALDMRIASNRYDDLVLWGGFAVRGTGRQRLVGGIFHYTLSIAVAGVYMALAGVLPRWPGWLRGLLFIQVENAVLYPGVPILQSLHPEVRSGRLPSLLTWRYFWVEIARHAAFGAVLGVIVDRRGRS